MPGSWRGEQMRRAAVTPDTARTVPEILEHLREQPDHAFQRLGDTRGRLGDREPLQKPKHFVLAGLQPTEDRLCAVRVHRSPVSV
jgi:hypothetical protein